MSSDDEFVDDESLFAAIEERANKYRIDIPLLPKPPAINIIFALKPATYPLVDFHTYMNFLFRCFSGKFERDYPHTLLRAACLPKRVFFCLDDSFKVDDLNFLFKEIIGVSPLQAIPSSGTGESLVLGKLANHFTPGNYEKIISYINSARKSFEEQLS